MIYLKLTPSCFVSPTGKVISYETEVAKIKDGAVVFFGAFSRTTTKHVHFLSGLTGLPLKRIRKDLTFHKLGRKEHFEKPGATISQSISLEILARYRSGNKSWEGAMVSLLADVEKIPKKDLALIQGFLTKKMGSKEAVENMVSVKKAFRLS